MNKAIALTAALLMAATTASADRLARNNVSCEGGTVSVYGFTVQGANGLTHYVSDADLDRCPAGTVGVPASVDMSEPDEVIEWLADNGVEIDDLQLRQDQTERKRFITLDDEGNEVVTIVRTTSRAVNGGW
jgi:hypothetical protein